ncbi:MAG: SUMF1/EgtB/PvdO family nonheme iron enzyme [Chloroflexota bacterium]
MRGGSWANNHRNCRSAYRNRNAPTNFNNNIGFRVALSHVLASVASSASRVR